MINQLLWNEVICGSLINFIGISIKIVSLKEITLGSLNIYQLSQYALV